MTEREMELLVQQAKEDLARRRMRADGKDQTTRFITDEEREQLKELKRLVTIAEQLLDGE